jgi:hypothetical protein
LNLYCAGTASPFKTQKSPNSTGVLKVVPATGLEPVQCYLLEPESSASANSATRATILLQ